MSPSFGRQPVQQAVPGAPFQIPVRGVHGPPSNGVPDDGGYQGNMMEGIKASVSVAVYGWRDISRQLAWWMVRYKPSVSLAVYGWRYISRQLAL